MIRILVSDSFADAGMSILAACSDIEVVSNTGLSPEELREELQNYDDVDQHLHMPLRLHVATHHTER